jgi:hypothetical protein
VAIFEVCLCLKIAGSAAAEQARLLGPLDERLEEHERQCRSIKEAHSTVLAHPRLAGRRSVLLSDTHLGRRGRALEKITDSHLRLLQD